MSGKIKRKIFKLGKSYVVTLPHEWIKQTQTNEVFVLCNNFVLLVPKEHEDLMNEVLEMSIKKVLQTGYNPTISKSIPYKSSSAKAIEDGD